MRKLGSFRLIAPAAVLGHLGAISLKLPNFLTTSQDVTKGADQANDSIEIVLKINKKWVENKTRYYLLIKCPHSIGLWFRSVFPVMRRIGKPKVKPRNFDF